MYEQHYKFIPQHYFPDRLTRPPHCSDLLQSRQMTQMKLFLIEIASTHRARSYWRWLASPAVDSGHGVACSLGRRGQQRTRPAVPRLRGLRAQDPALGGAARLLQGRHRQLAARRTALGALHELLVLPEDGAGRESPWGGRRLGVGGGQLTSAARCGGRE